jgi:hypothetical protein
MPNVGRGSTQKSTSNEKLDPPPPLNDDKDDTDACKGASKDKNLPNTTAPISMNSLSPQPSWQDVANIDITDLYEGVRIHDPITLEVYPHIYIYILYGARNTGCFSRFRRFII